MKIGLLISIREKSKRFPGKVFKKINGQTVTENMVDRLKIAKGYDNLIIATSDDPRDLVFGQIAEKKNIDIFYGDREDKLLRYLQIINVFKLDSVIIVDGDDLFSFPEIITETCEILRNKDCEVVFWKNLPLGAACSGLTKTALEKVMELKAESDTEVWGGYFTHVNFKIFYAESNNTLFNHPYVRLTLDYQEDYDLFKQIYNELSFYENKFSSIEVMDLLINKKPELVKINAMAQKKYELHLKKSAAVKFK